MNLKIAVPWPSKKSGQQRIKDSLSLWDEKTLLLCLAEPCDEKFVNKFNKTLMHRNSLYIGTDVPKLFILDMMKSVTQFDADWYGFSNSDVVPVGDIVGDKSNYDVLIFHRTEISEWSERFSGRSLDEEILKIIRNLQKSNLTYQEIQRYLNKNDIKPPSGFGEWDYLLVKECSANKETFFWGQDMFLFKANVVHKIIKDYFEEKDPILGTGGFDPRLSKWLMENFNSSRVLNKIFHKRHTSEWTFNEIEYKHNGGDILMKDIYKFYNHEYVKSMKDNGYAGFIPQHIKYLVKKNNPEVYEELFGE